MCGVPTWLQVCWPSWLARWSATRFGWTFGTGDWHIGLSSKVMNSMYIYILGECPRVATASKTIILIKIIFPLHVLSNNSNSCTFNTTIKDVGTIKIYLNLNYILWNWFFLLSHPLNRFLHACPLIPHICCLPSNKLCMPDNRLKGLE
jgi:hypothetical protein